VLTYDLNTPQGLIAPEVLCVTLNDEAAVDPARVLRRFDAACS
jgi:predicted NAD/FAD-binding protein